MPLVLHISSFCATFIFQTWPKVTDQIPLDNVKERVKLKSSVSRLVCILFPELEELVLTLRMVSVYGLPSRRIIFSKNLLCILLFFVKKFIIKKEDGKI